MFEIYAYGNVDTLTGVFNAIAAIMGGDDYFGLVKTVAVTGVLVAAFAGLFTPGRFLGWSWLIGFMLLYYGLFLPRADVVIVDKLGSQSPVVVGNVRQPCRGQIAAGLRPGCRHIAARSPQQQ